jgi:hypothetical protein
MKMELGLTKKKDLVEGDIYKRVKMVKIKERVQIRTRIITSVFPKS